MYGAISIQMVICLHFSFKIERHRRCVRTSTLNLNYYRLYQRLHLIQDISGNAILTQCHIRRCFQPPHLLTLLSLLLPSETWKREEVTPAI